MFELTDLQLIRVALDHITIKGSDSKTLTNLQLKVEIEMGRLSHPKPPPPPPAIKKT